MILTIRITDQDLRELQDQLRVSAIHHAQSQYNYIGEVQGVNREALEYAKRILRARSVLGLSNQHAEAIQP